MGQPTGELVVRWQALLSPLGPPPEAAERAFARVSEAYRAAARHYHNLEHVAEVLDAVASLWPLTCDPVTVELAAWLHDVVYDPRAKDNEERSADTAVELLSQMGLNAGRIEPVRGLILATRHLPEPPADTDTAVLLDADLSILGAAEDRYVRYARDIRREYAWVPERHYRDGRTQVLKGFLEREHIYHTEPMRDRLEAIARRNLVWEIELLK
jgi:predicted metal-dependent HD superfamily phosphohydrolase